MAVGYQLRYGGIPAAGLIQNKFNQWNNQRVRQGLPSPSYTQVTTKRKRKQYARNTVATQIRKLEPAKHSTVSDNSTAQAMKHNTIYETSPTQAITQGDGNTNRDGDEVFLEAIKINMTVVSEVTAGAYSYRILTGWLNDQVSCATSVASSLGSNRIFLPSTGVIYGHAAIINPKTFTCLDDRTVTINSVIAATNDVVNEIFTVPLKQKFAYQSTGSQYGKFKNLYIIVIGTVIGGTTAVTNAGAFYLNTDLIFKPL